MPSFGAIGDHAISSLGLPVVNGSLIAPSITLTSTVAAGVLSSGSFGSLTAPSVSVGSSVVAGVLSSVQNGSLVAPSISVTPLVSAGTLVGSLVLDGSLVSPSITVLPVVSAGILIGTSPADGSLIAPSVSVGSTIVAGSLSSAAAPTTCTLDQISIDAVADAVWEKILEDGFSAKEMMRLISSSLAGKVSGAGTGTVTFRSIGDTANRIIADVDDSGNRITVTKDVG